jgi:LuxR family maltose regulon positive regulatory protein
MHGQNAPHSPKRAILMTMHNTILMTKLYTPVPAQDVVARPDLLARLTKGVTGKLTLISAPAGFGKTTLVSTWVAQSKMRVAWLALDADDGEPARFLAYIIASLQTVAPHIGESIAPLLQSPQAPPPISLMPAVLNDIASIEAPFVLVLDDYHVLDSPLADELLAFLLEHQPPHMHIIMTTREDPPLPLARMRARRQLTEIRVGDLRFRPEETRAFLADGMGLALSDDDIATLEQRTEGWVAGLQLAGLSLQGQADVGRFIAEFSGSHAFVLDYLLEEVLHQQDEATQTFLLCTSILQRLTGGLCDAILPEDLRSSIAGQAMLERVHEANLFLLPLDNERRWYRYHHLFGDLLRQRLRAHPTLGERVNELHRRASVWHMQNGYLLEAFQHAVAGEDVDMAQRLIVGESMPLMFRGVVHPILNWLEQLPQDVLRQRPVLWVWSAQGSALTGQSEATERKLAQLEHLLREDTPQERDLLGHVATIRAMLATVQEDAPTLVEQSQKALDYLAPDNWTFRSSALWTLGYAYQVQGERDAALNVYADVLEMGEEMGNVINQMAALSLLGAVHLSNHDIAQAQDYLGRMIALAGDPPQPYACASFLGLGKIAYEHDDLSLAHEHAQKAYELGLGLPNVENACLGASCAGAYCLGTRGWGWRGGVAQPSRSLHAGTAF